MKSQPRAKKSTQRRGTILGFWIMALVFPIVECTAEEIHLALPGTRVVLSEENYVLCGTVSSGVETVAVTAVEKKMQVEVEVGGFSIPLDLSPGSNLVEVKSPDGETVRVEIFLQSEDEPAPADAVELVLHEFGIPEEIEDCGSCHPEKERQQGDWTAIEIEQSTCAEDCHEEEVDQPYLHGPTAIGNCVACHNPHGSQHRRFLVTATEHLCSRCHDIEAEEAGSVLHSPFEEGECVSCHSPHGGANQLFFLTEELAGTCFSCHDEDIMTRSSKHAPVADGDCSLCHQPHASDFEGLLVLEGNELCLDCHGDIGEALEYPVEHAAAQDECVSCHRPHSADDRPLLRMAATELCGDCHDDVAAEAAESEVGHPPVAEGDCGSCHEVHGSRNAGLLQKRVPELCFGCHDSVEDEIAQAEYKHGPAEDGECGMCHGVHGSKNPRLLVAYYDPDFYAEYTTDTYAFCFECHDEEVAEEETTFSGTEFREGDMNLHYLHVHRKKGRTCRVCHSPHASPQEHLLRESTSFGRWSIPIAFQATPAGGKCEVGCHRPVEYQR